MGNIILRNKLNSKFSIVFIKTIIKLLIRHPIKETKKFKRQGELRFQIYVLTLFGL